MWEMVIYSICKLKASRVLSARLFYLLFVSLAAEALLFAIAQKVIKNAIIFNS